MKVIITAYLIVLMSVTTSSFEVSKVEGADGKILGIIFDSDSNALVYGRDNEIYELFKVYKIDRQKNVTLIAETYDTVVKIMVNDKNDFYVITTRHNLNYVTIINIIRAGGTEMERIGYVSDNLLEVYADDYGNLIYNSDYLGVLYLKYNTSEAVKIEGLENFTISFPFGAQITDGNGNMYLSGYIENEGVKNNQLVVITTDPNEKILEAKFIEGVLDDPVNDYIEQLAVTSNSEVLISITNNLVHDIPPGSLKKLSDNAITTIFANEGYLNYWTKTGKTRTVITACDYLGLVCSVSYMTLNNEIVTISNLQNKSLARLYKFAIDDDGSIFIATNNMVDESTLKFLNYTSTSTVDVNFGDETQYVDKMELDRDGNLWILTNGVLTNRVYFLEKGSLEPVEVPGARNLVALDLDINKQTNEVFISTIGSLYVITKNSD